MEAVFAEIDEAGSHIAVYFRYRKDLHAKIKSVRDAKFRSQADPVYWELPLTMDNGRRLRQLFGDELMWGEALLAWGRTARRDEQRLQSLASATDWPLEDLHITQAMPAMAQRLRPFQRADVKKLSEANALNLNEQGLGKTFEHICAVYEAGLQEGAHLVLCQRSAVETAWFQELNAWLPDYISIFATENTAERKADFDLAYELHQKGETFWFVATYDFVRQEGVYEYDLETGRRKRVGMQAKDERLFGMNWRTFTIDEYPASGMTGSKTLGAGSFRKIKAERRYAMSGTPMGGKPIKLFPALQFIEPKRYTSKWKWAEAWLQVGKDDRGYTTVGGIQEGREDAFWRMISQHAVRHLKTEVAKDLPPKQYVDVWCHMTPKQARQYDQFARDAEIRIDEYNLGAVNVLAEYTRLKMFATARCEVQELGEHDDGRLILKLKPTPDSGKLPVLLDKLKEVGIDPADPAGDACAVVASQHRETVDMVHAWLNGLGIKAEKITGNVTRKGERARIIKEFQEGRTRVLCLTTKAGGTSITVDRADTIHILDETWVPDDQAQVEDRIHRISRSHQVTCYYYRSRGTIEEYIAQVNAEKAWVNEDILDLRRNGLRATKGAS